ncbi:MAG: cobyric acid synthase [Synergistales bacterium]|nr:cobyric acid synthase [Synergistales bacterium]MDY6402055.1 cobyric acid synthase [Synergistales bacterium]MDY6404170.1 cobyric acid synthase [Synergistales bacterium]MDY6410818.1 cobyric acid synthase [Synergistales bacterium]MDY6413987.1 cobyric acid synthase [Synergistales bacterium]
MNGIMIQGTSSDSGKSFIVTGLCRLLSKKNFRVCPFKSQNMSNNFFITHDSLEMSTAQAVQARAAGLRPEVFMNPILLKPQHEKSSEIILNGKKFDKAAEKNFYYGNFTEHEGINAVREALEKIKKNFDAIIIEGAGSPAEINLNEHEIVNMRIAREADVPVILAADVDRGGSLASVAGTLELLGRDRERVKGIIFNKFRGDINLFRSAVEWTENYTGVKVLGVVPFAKNILLEAEDSLSEDFNKNLEKNSREKFLTGEEAFDAIADLLEKNLDVNFLRGLMFQ